MAAPRSLEGAACRLRSSTTAATTRSASTSARPRAGTAATTATASLTPASASPRYSPEYPDLGEQHNGTQERRRQLQERSRLPVQTARGQAFRRAAGQRRFDPRPPAGREVQAGQER